MSLPNSVNELQQLLGTITYLGKFIPNLVEVASPLRTLLKKKDEFKLEKPQVTSYTLCLNIFNRNLQTPWKLTQAPKD